MNTFHEILMKYRFNNNLSQEQLGIQLDVSTMTIHRWEKATHLPSKKRQTEIESFINDRGTFLDPYELLTKEILNLSNKIIEFTEYLKEFHN